MGCGKLRNQAKIAPGGLPRRENILFSETLFFAKLEQRGFSLNIDVVMHPIAMAPNASEMNKYYPFRVWYGLVRFPDLLWQSGNLTRSGHTLGT